MEGYNKTLSPRQPATRSVTNFRSFPLLTLQNLHISISNSPFRFPLVNYSEDYVTNNPHNYVLLLFMYVAYRTIKLLCLVLISLSREGVYNGINGKKNYLHAEKSKLYCLLRKLVRKSEQGTQIIIKKYYLISLKSIKDYFYSQKTSKSVIVLQCNY